MMTPVFQCYWLMKFQKSEHPGLPNPMEGLLGQSLSAAFEMFVVHLAALELESSPSGKRCPFFGSSSVCDNQHRGSKPGTTLGQP